MSETTKKGRGVACISPKPLREILAKSECPSMIQGDLYNAFLDEFKERHAMVGDNLFSTREKAFNYLCYVLPYLSDGAFAIPEDGTLASLVKDLCNKYFFAPSRGVTSIFINVYGDFGSYLTESNPYGLEYKGRYTLGDIQQWMEDSGLYVDSDYPSSILEKTNPTTLRGILKEFENQHV